jgi:hypothetical protein
VTPTAPSDGDAIGSLDHELAQEVPPGQDAPFQALGRRGRVLGTALEGTEGVWLDSVRVASGLRLEGEDVLGATLSPLGVERRLRVKGAEITERIVAPRDAPFVLFEWEGAGSPVPLEVSWRTGLELAAPHGGDLRGEGGGSPVTFRVSGSDVTWAVEPPAATGRTVRAACVVPGAGRVQLAVAGGRDPDELERALRGTARGGVVPQSRRGALARLRHDRIALASPDPALGVAVERAKAWLSDATPSLETSADALLAGDFDHARQALLAAATPPAPTALVRLAGLFLDWTGDVETIHGCWPNVVAAWAHGEGWRDMLHMAEALGDGAVADSARAAGARSGAAHGPRRVACQDPAIASLQRLLGPEPDSPRGRLVLRPRPPLEWDTFQLRNLAMGDASMDVHYRRTESSHWFELEQTRGAAPVRVVLEPELAGVFRSARVDGVVAELAAVPAEGRSRVPVQIVLDHRRTLEVEMDEKKDARR